MLFVKRFSVRSALWLLLVPMFVFSCKKQDDFLDVKSNKTDVQPKTLSDFQAILDNYTVFNGFYAYYPMIATDNIYMPEKNIDAMAATDRNIYIWATDLFQGGLSYDWVNAYQKIEYANIVLDGLGTLPANTGGAWNNVKGSALFFRAYCFYQLSQIYCKPYSPSSAAQDLGIPLRMTSDVNVRSVRATLAQTYEKVLADLKSAVLLLPGSPLKQTRPSLPAAFALLSKVYLSMNDYDNALAYSDSALRINGTLIDYNTLPVANTNPFPPLKVGNPEVLFYAGSSSSSAITTNRSAIGRIDNSLYASYDENDLRKVLLFSADAATNSYKIFAPYTYSAYLFSGFATNELYLTRAECYARKGDLSSALNDLNNLMKNRYKTSSFVPYVTADKMELLSKILSERRKELPYTSIIRWEDLRRLNQDPAFAVTVTHMAHGITYTIPPGDKRYVFPIPDEEVRLNGLQQNDR